MGYVPVPCVRPPHREFLPGLDGELIDVTGFTPGPGLRRQGFSLPRPPTDYWGEALNLAIVLLLLALVLVPVLWLFVEAA